MKKVDIVLPVYNEEEVIEKFNLQLFKTINSLDGKYLFDVIYVLDKSQDDTLARLRQICADCERVKVLVLSRRFGHQLSLVAGMDHCDGDAVIMMDCDLEHPTEIIPMLLDKYEEGFDVVSTKRQYNKDISFTKKFLSKTFYRIVSAIAAIKIEEDAADFRLISRRIAKVFQTSIREQNQFLRGLFPWVGFNQTSIEYVSGTRKEGKSKYNLKRLMNFAVVGIISFSKTPLKMSIVLGILISLMSFVYGFYSIFHYFLYQEIPQGWTSIIATVSFLGGIQLIMLGIIGEYIGGIFDEVKGRPLYIIEEEITGKRVTRPQ